MIATAVRAVVDRQTPYTRRARYLTNENGFAFLKDPLLQQSWAKESLIAQMLPPMANDEPESRIVFWDIVLIQG